jgi:hypothetical protein
VPETLYRAKMREFARKLPSYVANFGERGFRVTPLIEARLRRLYGRWPLLYWLYVWPVLHLPRSVYATLLKVRRAW